jgi:hypothetical protein
MPVIKELTDRTEELEAIINPYFLETVEESGSVLFAA